MSRAIPTWDISVTHIDINVGDSTLIKAQGLPATIGGSAPDPIFVLIDGGSGNRKTSRSGYTPPFDNLIKALNHQCVRQSSPSPLNAVVVTHYDYDHVGGITQLLKYKAMPSSSESKTPISKNPFIYQANSSSKTTFFYDLGDPSGKKGPYAKYKKTFTTPELKKYAVKRNSDSGGDLIGTDIFTGQKGVLTDSGGVLTSIWDDKTSFVKICHDIRSAKRPVLLCVAANKKTLLGIIPEKDRPTTESNKVSLAFLLFDEFGEILYYLTGDLNAEESNHSLFGESKIIQWIAGGSTVVPDDKLKIFSFNPISHLLPSIRFIKFSHHGSPQSTPIPLLTSFDVDVGIISAGDKHYHPSLELLLCLSHINQTREEKGFPEINICATNYPYYLDPVNHKFNALLDSNTKFNLKAMQKIFSDNKITNGFAKTILDHIEKYKNLPKADKVEGAAILQEEIQLLWAEMCGQEYLEIPSARQPPPFFEIDPQPSYLPITDLDTATSSNTMLIDEQKHLFSELQLRLSANMTYRILASTATVPSDSSDVAWIQLTAAQPLQPLDLFINALPSKCLTLADFKITTTTNSWKIRGNLLNSTLADAKTESSNPKQANDFFRGWLAYCAHLSKDDVIQFEIKGVLDEESPKRLNQAIIYLDSSTEQKSIHSLQLTPSDNTLAKNGALAVSLPPPELKFASIIASLGYADSTPFPFGELLDLIFSDINLPVTAGTYSQISILPQETKAPDSIDKDTLYLSQVSAKISATWMIKSGKIIHEFTADELRRLNLPAFPKADETAQIIISGSTLFWKIASCCPTYAFGLRFTPYGRSRYTSSLRLMLPLTDISISTLKLAFQKNYLTFDNYLKLDTVTDKNFSFLRSSQVGFATELRIGSDFSLNARVQLQPNKQLRIELSPESKLLVDIYNIGLGLLGISTSATTSPFESLLASLASAFAIEQLTLLLAHDKDKGFVVISLPLDFTFTLGGSSNPHAFTFAVQWDLKRGSVLGYLAPPKLSTVVISEAKTEVGTSMIPTISSSTRLASTNAHVVSDLLSIFGITPPDELKNIGIDNLGFAAQLPLGGSQGSYQINLDLKPEAAEEIAVCDTLIITKQPLTSPFKPNTIYISADEKVAVTILWTGPTSVASAPRILNNAELAQLKSAGLPDPTSPPADPIEKDDGPARDLFNTLQSVVGAWHLTDEIRLTEVNMQVSKAEGLSAKLSALLLLNSDMVIVDFEYQDDVWECDITIAIAQCDVIHGLLPRSVSDELSAILPAELKVSGNLIFKVMMDTHAKTKTILSSARLNLGEVVCDIGFYYQTGSASGYSFGCKLVLPTLPDVPLLQQICLPATLYWLSASRGFNFEDPAFSEFNSFPLPTGFDPSKFSGSGLYICIDSIQEPLFLSTRKSVASLSPSTAFADLEVKERKSLIRLKGNDVPSTPVWIKINRNVGPLTLERLGFAYGDGRLSVLFDGALALGPLKLQALGLTFSFAFSTINDISTYGFSFNGLAMDYKQAGALSLSGEFARDLADPTADSFSGEIALGMESFNTGAIGEYRKSKQDSQVSLFVFGRLRRALGGPPFFYVTGLAAGFGYNQLLRMPTQDEVVNFPLVLGSVDPTQLSDNLGEVLQLLLHPPTGSPWLTPQLDNYWLTAGVDFTTFNVIGTRALIAVEFGKEFQLAVIGRSYLQFPQSGDFKVFNVEMGLEAVLKPEEGVFNMSAILSPNSYVLTPDCHLTGGFAFYTWFKDQLDGARAGDFVVTLGGYHPSFPAPSWYPRVPRLGFNWRVSDYVHIDGESYFALTPAAVMGGGRLQALFHCGALKAWLKAAADFLIQWQPLLYDARISISVGASLRLNLLFTTTTLTAEIGADLHVFGPPTQGNVHVDWFIISFNIPFPDPLPGLSVQPQSWDQFYSMLSASALKQATHDQSGSDFTFNKIVLESGLLREEENLDEKTGKSETRWIIRRSALRLSCEAVMPATDITFNKTSLMQGAISPMIYIRPMSDAKPKNSEEKVIVKIDSHIPQIQIDRIEGDEKISENISRWSYQLLKRNAPAALWGDPTSDALSPDNSLVKDSITGVMLWPQPAKLTPATASAVNIETLRGEDFPIQKTGLPLKIQPPPDPADKAGPPISSSSDSRLIISKSIGMKQQQPLADMLKNIGLFRGTAPLDDMKNFAAEASQILLEPPLLENSRRG